jgi:hypothetical protein
MYELRSREEFIRAIIGNEVVLIGFYDPGDSESRVFDESLKSLERVIDQRILVCRVNLKDHPDCGVNVLQTPSIRVYYRGEVIFEQIGCLSTVDLNVNVIRRGIRDVFAKRAINIRI